MGIFDRFKKTSVPKSGKPVWRDALGRLRCLGDSCPKDCDDTCPIYLNTQAAMLMRINEKEKAFELFKMIIEIAPDFYDAWNGMAVVYGGRGNYQKAYECYLKAHEISPESPGSLLGLALACKDLERYEECLKWCDKHDKITSNPLVTETRKIAFAALGR